MTFYQLLDKYNVRYQKKHLSYIPWAWRNGQKLTRICAHTEGVPQNIPGTADRDVFGWFNNQANGANAHGFITFSGLFIEYLPIEHGSWSVGNDDDNVQAYSIETQDNGRYNNPHTYTAAQYDTWARVYCAVHDFAKEHYKTSILFQHNNWGVIRHNDRIPTRACPGALDVNKIATMARQIWEGVNAPPPPPVPEPEQKPAPKEVPPPVETETPVDEVVHKTKLFKFLSYIYEAIKKVLN